MEVNFNATSTVFAGFLKFGGGLNSTSLCYMNSLSYPVPAILRLPNNKIRELSNLRFQGNLLQTNPGKKIKEKLNSFLFCVPTKRVFCFKHGLGLESKEVLDFWQNISGSSSGGEFFFIELMN